MPKTIYFCYSSSMCHWHYFQRRPRPPLPSATRGATVVVGVVSSGSALLSQQQQRPMHLALLPMTSFGNSI
ncbi:hypothetical protein D5086_028081 [Populus alba]|uniref:Uncharacterized protein n=1 Tax=Populus alba TaxID=43335 RepID=A0ACC4AY52_POPAL